MIAIIVLGVFALLAGTAYMLVVHGPQFGLELAFPVSEEEQRRRDARQGAKTFSELGSTLQGHKQTLTNMLSLGRTHAADSSTVDAGLPEPGATKSNQRGEAAKPSLANCLQEMMEQNQAAGQALHSQLIRLRELTANYGHLYDNEQRNIESYCSLTEKLDQVLHELEADGDSGDDRFAVTLARKMVRENDKLRLRLSGCETQIESLITDVSRLHRETRLDSLTQLPNRRAWEEKLAESTAETEQILVMLDLDRFKEVNDTHGHYAGDGVLNLVATMIRNTPEVAGHRIAGDEFAMLISGRLWNRTGHILEQLRRRVEKASLHDCGEQIRVTVSIGAALTLPGEPQETTLRRADEALYASKSTGGNCVHLHDGERICKVDANSPSRCTPPLPPEVSATSATALVADLS